MPYYSHYCHISWWRVKVIVFFDNLFVVNISTGIHINYFSLWTFEPIKRHFDVMLRQSREFSYVCAIILWENPINNDRQYIVQFLTPSSSVDHQWVRTTLKHHMLDKQCSFACFMLHGFPKYWLPWLQLREPESQHNALTKFLEKSSCLHR